MPCNLGLSDVYLFCYVLGFLRNAIEMKCPSYNLLWEGIGIHMTCLDDVNFHRLDNKVEFAVSPLLSSNFLFPYSSVWK